MSRLFLALAASLAASSLARADAPNYVPLASVQAEISAVGGGKLKPISREEMLFARGVFVGTPPVSPYPAGEQAMIGMFEDGSSALIFINGGKSCGKMGLAPSITKLLLEIDKST